MEPRLQKPSFREEHEAEAMAAMEEQLSRPLTDEEKAKIHELGDHMVEAGRQVGESVMLRVDESDA